MLVRKGATLDKISGKSLLLLTEDQETITVAKGDFPDSRLGDRFVMQILPEAEAVLEREALARELLNQLINDEKATGSG